MVSSHHSVVTHIILDVKICCLIQRIYNIGSFVAFLRLILCSLFKKIYLHLVVLGLCCCAGFSPVGESWGYSPGAVHRLLFVAEHAWASVVVTYRLLSSDSVAVLQAQLLCSTQHLPQPVIEPVSPALASRFFTSEPPGKPKNFLLNELLKKTMKFKFN